MLLTPALIALTHLACQCVAVTARPTVEWDVSVTRPNPAATSTTGESVYSPSMLMPLQDQRLILRLIIRFDKRMIRPSPISTLLDTIRYQVPNTDVTLLIDPGIPFPDLQYAFRALLSSCLVEVENIIDVAGDGIIPGFNNRYAKTGQFEDEHVTGKVQLDISSFHITGPDDRLMTYGILFNALRGLWHVMIIDGFWWSLHKIRIEREDKGTVGYGFLGIIPQPTLAR